MSASGDYRQLIQQALSQLDELKRKLAASERARTEPIAVVGMGCRFPGSANSPDQFWELLRSGRDAVSEISAERWDVDAYYDPDPQLAGRVYTRRAALLDRRTIEDFDPQFFGIAPREAAAMDPQQRMLLEVCWESVEHAGISLDGLRGSATGLFVGMCTDDYLHLYNNLNAPERIDAYTSLGTARSIAVGRVSYLLGWEGPAIQLDTACSSALMSLHLAAQSLRVGECDLALAGAVNLQLSPVWTVGLCRLKALSLSGRCSAFDAAADGFVRGEGCGMVVLKRLSDAERDHDSILAVLRGSAVNHDGKSGGLTVPNQRAQEKLIRTALANAKIQPGEVSYIEAHGTGTLLGDPIELGALKSVFAPGRDATQPLLVGSVKTNVGHLEGAAGVAGLMKIVLAMRHGEIPGNLHFDRPNPLIDWNFPVQIPTAPVPWPGGRERRIAGISAFGFSGTNVHVVLEGPPNPPVTDSDGSPTWPIHVLPISAKTKGALLESARSYERLLASDPGKSLAGWAYSAAAGRSHFSQRMAVVAVTTDDARRALERYIQDSGAADSRLFAGESLPEPKVAWWFPEKHDPVLRGTDRYYASNPAFRKAWDECCRLCGEFAAEIVPVLNQRSGSEWDRLLTSSAAQLVTFIHQFCLAQMWKSWGVSPAQVAGRGIGFYSAAVTAGVLSLNDALRLVLAADRARQSQQPAIYQSVVADVEFHRPCLPMASEVVDRIAGPEVGTADYWLSRSAQHTPASAAESFRSQGVTFAVVLGSLGASPDVPPGIPIGACLADDPAATQIDDFDTLARGIADAYVHGIAIDWPELESNRPRPRRPLPTYPFQRTRCWLNAETERPKFAVKPSRAVDVRTGGHPLLGARLESAGSEQIFELHVTPRTDGLWNDHRIYGQPIMPATGYLEMAITAASATAAARPTACQVRNLSIERALKMPSFPETDVSNPAVTVQTILSPNEAGWSCRVFSRPEGESDWQTHATVDFVSAVEERSPILADRAALQATCSQSVDLDLHYARFEQTGLQFGPRFHSLQQLYCGDREALAQIRLPDSLLANAADYGAHPVLLDAALQAVASVIPRAGEYLPVGVEQFTIFGALGTQAWCHARLVDSEVEAGRDITAGICFFDDDGRILAEMKNVRFREVPRELVGGSHPSEPKSLKYRIEWPLKPLAADESRAEAPGAWLILNDKAGIGARLAERLRRAGHRCVCVDWGEAADNRAESHLVFPGKNPDALSGFLRGVQLPAEQWTGVVHLWALSSSERRHETFGKEEISVNQARICGSAAALAQHLAREGASPRVILVTQQAQLVAGRESSLDAAQAALWGFGRTLRLEHSEFRCRCIDLENADAEECAEHVWREIQAADEENQVAYRAGARHVCRLTRATDSEKLLIPQQPYHLQLPTYGVFERFQAAPVSRRSPEAGQVEVEIRASGLNFRDVLRGLGMLQNYEQSLGIAAAADCPFGFEAAGIITAAGAGVPDFSVGDEVVVMTAGTLASHITVNASQVVRKPPQLSFVEAASIPLAFVTAHHALEQLAGLRSGQKVLIHAAAGGVGLAAVQMALNIGAEVYATASPAKWDALRALGVQWVTNSRNTEFAD